MSEMENTADHLLVLGRGRLIAACSMAEFIGRSTVQVRVRTPEPELLARAVTAAGARVTLATTATTATAATQDTPITPITPELEVTGLTEERIGDIAFANAVRLHHLSTSRASLEQAFMELTADSVEYRADSQLVHSGMET
jgi:ABC-2 type transport system ATP-binding protein